jgi:Ca2+-binding EF-hand superfamily protein
MHAKLEGAAQAVLDVRQRLSTVREELSAAAKTAFERIDVDGSGELDKFELKGLCAELGIGINVRQLKSAWKWMDKDGDGRIELEEFDWCAHLSSATQLNGEPVSTRVFTRGV